MAEYTTTDIGEWQTLISVGHVNFIVDREDPAHEVLSERLQTAADYQKFADLLAADPDTAFSEFITQPIQSP